MDETGRKILDYLQEDGRASYTEIAEEIGVSEGTVRNRVQQMTEDGTIKRFTVELSEPAGLRAVVMVTVDPDRDIATIISSFPADCTLYEVTGDHDMVVRFSRDTSTALNEALEQIRKVEGVTNTKTYTVLESHST